MAAQSSFAVTTPTSSFKMLCYTSVVLPAANRLYGDPKQSISSLVLILHPRIQCSIPENNDN